MAIGRGISLTLLLATCSVLFAVLAVHLTWALQPQEWVLVEYSESESDGMLLRQEMLQHPTKQAPLVVAAKLTFSMISGVALGVLGFLVLSVSLAQLHPGALLVSTLGVASLFLVAVAAASAALHAMLGPLAARLTSLLAAPVAFWSSVNFLAVLTKMLHLYHWLSSQRQVLHFWLAQRWAADGLARITDVVHKVAPSLTDPFLHKPMAPVATEREWAARLQEVTDESVRLEQHEVLALQVQAPDLPPMRLSSPLASLWKAGACSVEALREASGGGAAALTAAELLLFIWVYLRCLVRECAEHARLQLWLAQALRALPRQGCSDAAEWRMVYDQYIWYKVQHPGVTDIAARVLAQDPNAAAALRIWCALDAAVAWCHLLPPLWDAPSQRAQELKDRRGITAKLGMRGI